MVEPGGLPSMGLHRVEHNRSNLAAAAPSIACGWPGFLSALPGPSDIALLCTSVQQELLGNL